MRRLPSCMDRRNEQKSLKQSILYNDILPKKSDKKFKFFRGNGLTRGLQKSLIKSSNKQTINHKKAIERYRSIELVNSQDIKNKHLSLLMSVSSQKQFNTISNNVSQRNGGHEENERGSKLKKKRYLKGGKENLQMFTNSGTGQNEGKTEENARQRWNREKIEVSIGELGQQKKSQLIRARQHRSKEGKSIKKRRFLTQSASTTNNHINIREKKQNKQKEGEKYQEQCSEKTLEIRKKEKKETMNKNESCFRDQILEISDILPENKNSMVDQESILKNINELQQMLYGLSRVRERGPSFKNGKRDKVKDYIQINMLSQESLTKSASFLGDQRYGIKCKGSKKKVQLEIDNIENIYNCSNIDNGDRQSYLKNKNLRSCQNSKKDLKSYRNKIKQIRNNTLIMKSIDKLKNVFPDGFFPLNSAQPL